MSSKTLESRSEWQSDGPVKSEVGIIVHEGREFASGGAFVSPSHAVGYPDFPRFADRVQESRTGRMKAWDGTDLGSCRIVASWPVRSWVGSRMYQIEATIDGRTYTGRGFGSGMLWRGKAKKA